MGRIAKLAWAAVAALVVAVGGVSLYRANVTVDKLVGQGAQIGGDFELTTHEGKRLSNRDLAGKPFAVFFGFTHCPDVCPTALLELSNILQKLGPDADKMRYLFISVDHEQDTPAHLKTYLSSFDARIIGLTGTAEEIAAVARGYRAYYQKVPTKEGFTYNHTALTYLMGRDGRYVAHIGYQEAEDRQIAKLRKLANGH
jgi:protein SCO1/2